MRHTMLFAAVLAFALCGCEGGVGAHVKTAGVKGQAEVDREARRDETSQSRVESLRERFIEMLTVAQVVPLSVETYDASGLVGLSHQQFLVLYGGDRRLAGQTDEAGRTTISGHVSLLSADGTAVWYMRNGQAWMRVQSPAFYPADSGQGFRVVLNLRPPVPVAQGSGVAPVEPQPAPAPPVPLDPTLSAAELRAWADLMERHGDIANAARFRAAADEKDGGQ